PGRRHPGAGRQDAHGGDAALARSGAGRLRPRGRPSPPRPRPRGLHAADVRAASGGLTGRLRGGPRDHGGEDGRQAPGPDGPGGGEALVCTVRRPGAWRLAPMVGSAGSRAATLESTARLGEQVLPMVRAAAPAAAGRDAGPAPRTCRRRRAVPWLARGGTPPVV